METQGAKENGPKKAAWSQVSRILINQLMSLGYLPQVGIEEPSEAHRQRIFILKEKLVQSADRTVLKRHRSQERQGISAY
jgi:hypothetical protein